MCRTHAFDLTLICATRVQRRKMSHFSLSTISLWSSFLQRCLFHATSLFASFCFPFVLITSWFARQITGILLSLYEVTISCSSWCVSCLSPSNLPPCVVFFRLVVCFSFVCFRWNELELLPMPLLIYLLPPFLSLFVSIHLDTSRIQSVLRLHFHRCRPNYALIWLIVFLRDNPPSRHCVVMNNTCAIPSFYSFHWNNVFYSWNWFHYCQPTESHSFRIMFLTASLSLTCSGSALLHLRTDTRCALSCAPAYCFYCVAVTRFSDRKVQCVDRHVLRIIFNAVILICYAIVGWWAFVSRTSPRSTGLLLLNRRITIACSFVVVVPMSPATETRPYNSVGPKWWGIGWYTLVVGLLNHNTFFCFYLSLLIVLFVCGLGPTSVKWFVNVVFFFAVGPALMSMVAFVWFELLLISLSDRFRIHATSFVSFVWLLLACVLQITSFVFLGGITVVCIHNHLVWRNEGNLPTQRNQNSEKKREMKKHQKVPEVWRKCLSSEIGLCCMCEESALLPLIKLHRSLWFPVNSRLILSLLSIGFVCFRCFFTGCRLMTRCLWVSEEWVSRSLTNTCPKLIVGYTQQWDVAPAMNPHCLCVCLS